jgi:hypothetical protein
MAEPPGLRLGNVHLSNVSDARGNVVIILLETISFVWKSGQKVCFWGRKKREMIFLLTLCLAGSLDISHFMSL